MESVKIRKLKFINVYFFQKTIFWLTFYQISGFAINDAYDSLLTPVDGQIHERSITQTKATYAELHQIEKEATGNHLVVRWNFKQNYLKRLADQLTLLLAFLACNLTRNSPAGFSNSSLLIYVYSPFKNTVLFLLQLLKCTCDVEERNQSS